MYYYLVECAKKENVKKLVVGAIILNEDNKVLIVRRKVNDFMGEYYEIPGGNCEIGETIQECLFREIKEETNFDIVSIESFVNNFDYLSSSGNLSRQFNFVVKVKNSKEIILTEHDDYKWIDYDEINNINKMSLEVKCTLAIYFFNVLGHDL